MRDALAGIGGGQLEDAAIPAHAGGRVVPSQRVEAFAGQRGIVLERQLDGPIVGQIDGSPVAVVEGDGAGREEVSGLLEIAGPAAAESEVFCGVVGMAEMEAPAKIEQQPLAESVRKGWIGCGGRVRRVLHNTRGEWTRGLGRGLQGSGDGRDATGCSRCGNQQAGLQEIPS